MICRLSFLFIFIMLTIGCSMHNETMRYTKQTLPQWILDEWKNAQDELQKIDPPIPAAYSVSPYRFIWIQLDRPFWNMVDNVGTRQQVYGLYQRDVWGKKRIIICCGKRVTVRHEAFHAIMDTVGDARKFMHYSTFKSEIKGSK